MFGKNVRNASLNLHISGVCKHIKFIITKILSPACKIIRLEREMWNMRLSEKIYWTDNCTELCCGAIKGELNQQLYNYSRDKITGPDWLHSGIWILTRTVSSPVITLGSPYLGSFCEALVASMLGYVESITEEKTEGNARNAPGTKGEKSL